MLYVDDSGRSCIVGGEW